MRREKLWIVLLVVMALCLTGCGAGGGSGAQYKKYADAYRKVSAAGGMHAKFDLTLKMDGTKTESTGDLKLKNDGGKVILYYEMDIGEQKVTQFSDGAYVYTDNGKAKTKYEINAKPSNTKDDTKEKKDQQGSGQSQSDFDTSAFASEFSSMLEAGKIKELGVLDPIEEKYIMTTQAQASGDSTVYTFTFSDGLMKTFLNALVADQVKNAENALTFEDLKDFVYTATEKDGMIRGITYSATTKVKVPGALMANGSDATYDLDIDLKITFVDPGQAIAVELPATDEYEAI